MPITREQIVASFPREWGEPTSSTPVPKERYEQYEGLLPPIVFDMWRRFGFASFHDGLGWLCDPAEWQPAVDAWTGRVDLAMDEDTFTPYFRGAFGEIQCWGKRTGPSLSLAPYASLVTPADQAADLAAEGPEKLAMSMIMATEPEYFDLEGEDDKPLFGPVLRRLGPLTADQMYTFAPVKQLGGDWTVETAIVERAVPHIVMLAGLGEADVIGDLAKTLERDGA